MTNVTCAKSPKSDVNLIARKFERTLTQNVEEREITRRKQNGRHIMSDVHVFMQLQVIDRNFLAPPNQSESRCNYARVFVIRSFSYQNQNQSNQFLLENKYF